MGSKEDVRARLNIADVIGEHVRLLPAGRNRLKGLCPFHAEKTPSFHVDTEQGYYYCFGCKASGDVFSFVQEAEGLSFGDALQKLAERAGVALERGEQGTSDHKRRDLYDINEFALRYFQDQLRAAQGQAAREYLKGRGLTGRVAADFELGYAPSGWDGLLGWAKTRGIAPEMLLSAGLLGESGGAGRVYDRFRNRVMFPIRDHLGRLVGFGGRVLDDNEKPKYLNSPETAVFKKGELLYGLQKARAAGGSELVVVEGYMDVIAMHAQGLKQAVATLGTALTAEHAALLSRLGTEKITLLFDHDEAGIRATLSGLDQTLGARFDVRAAALPAGLDPADVLRAEGGKEALAAALNEAKEEAQFRLQAAIERHGLAGEGKRKVLHELLPRMLAEDPLDSGAQRVRELVCDALDIEYSALGRWLAQKGRRQLTPTHLAGMSKGETDHELALLQQLLLSPELLSKLDGEQQWKNPTVGKLVLALRGSSREEVLAMFRGQPEEPLLLRLLFEGRESKAVSRKAREQFEERLPQYAKEAAQDIQHRLTLREMKEELSRLKAELPSCTPEQMRPLLAEISGLQRAIEAEKQARL